MKQMRNWVLGLAAAPLLAAGAARADTIFDVNQALLNDVGSATPSTNYSDAVGSFQFGHTSNPASPSQFNESELVYTPAFDGISSLSGFFVNNNAIVPALLVNTSSSPITATQIGVATLGGNELLLHPGGLGVDAFADPVSADLRYAATTAGLYSITGMFQKLSDGVTVDSVYDSNGNSLFTTSSGGPVTSFATTTFLSAGQTIDFVVAVTPGTSIGSDSTGLYANVAAVTPLPKSAWAGAGLMGVVGFATLRRKSGSSLA